MLAETHHVRVRKLRVLATGEGGSIVANGEQVGKHVALKNMQRQLEYQQSSDREAYTEDVDKPRDKGGKIPAHVEAC